MRYARRLELFNRMKTEYLGFLTAALWKLTGERELFAEALQYAMLGIWQHADKLTTKASAGYIYRIALTANARAWRNRIGKDGQIADEPTSSQKGPQTCAAESEIAQQARKAVSTLAPQQAKAVVMRYFEQKDYATIARNLNCTEAGARSHVSKAVASLRRKLVKFAGQEL